MSQPVFRPGSTQDCSYERADGTRTVVASDVLEQLTPRQIVDGLTTPGFELWSHGGSVTATDAGVHLDAPALGFRADVTGVVPNSAVAMLWTWIDLVSDLRVTVNLWALGTGRQAGERGTLMTLVQDGTPEDVVLATQALWSPRVVHPLRSLASRSRSGAISVAH